MQRIFVDLSSMFVTSNGYADNMSAERSHCVEEEPKNLNHGAPFPGCLNIFLLSGCGLPPQNRTALCDQFSAIIILSSPFYILRRHVRLGMETTIKAIGATNTTTNTTWVIGAASSIRVVVTMTMPEGDEEETMREVVAVSHNMEDLIIITIKDGRIRLLLNIAEGWRSGHNMTIVSLLGSGEEFFWFSWFVFISFRIFLELDTEESLPKPRSRRDAKVVNQQDAHVVYCLTISHRS